MNNRNLEYDQSLEEEEMVKAERSKTGPYPAKDLDRVFMERMLEQGMSREEAQTHIDQAHAVTETKKATKQ